MGSPLDQRMWEITCTNKKHPVVLSPVLYPIIYREAYKCSLYFVNTGVAANIILLLASTFSIFALDLQIILYY